MRDASEVKTIKRYEEDAYQAAFDAVIVSVQEAAGGKDGAPCLDVVLDQTCFFPEEGGQSPDKGVIAGMDVVDVRIRGGEIHHVLKMQDAEHPLTEGDRVHGMIDWPHRFSNMQQHSGEHLFSGIVHRRFGFENKGFHLSDREVTLDFDGVIPEDAIREIEQEVNEVIWRNIPSEIRVTTPEERADLVYRSKLDLDGDVRIVTFPGVDSCACCAPHVRRTGEIGVLKVISVINWKGGVRISILCGGRALAYFREAHAIVAQTAGYLTTSPDQIYPQVVRLKEETRRMEAELRKAASEKLIREALLIPDEEEHAAVFAEAADGAAMRAAVSAMTERHSGYCGVFCGSEADGYTFVIGSAKSDCRVISSALKERFGARGGGKPDMVQGFVKASEHDVRSVLASRAE